MRRQDMLENVDALHTEGTFPLPGHMNHIPAPVYPDQVLDQLGKGQGLIVDDAVGAFFHRAQRDHPAGSLFFQPVNGRDKGTRHIGVKGDQRVVLLQVRQQIDHEFTDVVILIPVIIPAGMVIREAGKEQDFQVFPACRFQQALHGFPNHILIQRGNKYGDFLSFHTALPQFWL